MISAVLITETYQNIPWFFAILIPIFLGSMGGLLNGLLVGIIGLNPFISTLGTYLVFGGATLLVSPTAVHYGFPEYYLLVGDSEYISVALLAITLLFLWLMLNKSRLGTHIYSVGSDLESSKMLGLNTGMYICITYIFSGFFCGISALLYTGFLGSVPPMIADQSLFPAIAAAVLGGISLSGGRGNIVNVFGGALLLGTVGSGIVMLGISSYGQTVVYGVIVVFAVVFDKYRTPLLNDLKAKRV
jgi:ribose/xylose/arabinose/galactoside ABC-type transport system permease subunit